jgi:hypothetical protein
MAESGMFGFGLAAGALAVNKQSVLRTSYSMQAHEHGIKHGQHLA